MATITHITDRERTQAVRIAELEAENARLRAVLLDVARAAEELKRPCGMDPEGNQAIRNSQYMGISYAARAASKATP